MNHESEKRAFAVVARHFANWQKQQMMKDAVDGEIKTIYRDAVKAESVGFSTQKTGMFEGDKVKLIVIREGWLCSTV